MSTIPLSFFIAEFLLTGMSPEIANGVILHENIFNSSLNPGVSCYRIPSLVTAPNGDLIAVMDERVPSCSDLGDNRDINIVIRRSSDNGATWTKLATVYDFPEGVAASDPSMIVDKTTGDVFLFFDVIDHNKKEKQTLFHVMKSSDNGKTWDKPTDITRQITRPEWSPTMKMGITAGRGIQTRSGVLLNTLWNDGNIFYVYGSEDHGKTWQLFTSPITPGDESEMVELADGTWMINSRVDKTGMRHIHTSADKGKTWMTKDEPALIDPGCNASIIRYTRVADGYTKNRLLFSNAKHVDERQNMTVRISYDEGATWSEGKTIYAGDTAYSSLTILNNGDIGILFEKDDHTENVFARFTLDWLTDGKDTYEAPRQP